MRKASHECTVVTVEPGLRRVTPMPLSSLELASQNVESVLLQSSPKQLHRRPGYSSRIRWPKRLFDEDVMHGSKVDQPDSWTELSALDGILIDAPSSNFAFSCQLRVSDLGVPAKCNVFASSLHSLTPRDVQVLVASESLPVPFKR